MGSEIKIELFQAAGKKRNYTMMGLQTAVSIEPTDSTEPGKPLQNYTKVKQGGWVFNPASTNPGRSVL